MAEVSAACSGGALRVPARGTCSAVIMVAPTRAAASAWTGAIAGSLGAGWPRVTAISSMASERAKTAHSSQAASARKRMIASSDSGLATNRWTCCHPGQVRGSGDPVNRGQRPGQAGQQRCGRGDPGCGAQQPPGQRGSPSHGSGPSMPRTGTAEAVAWTVTACSPAADRICIGWTMVTVTVTRPPVAVAVPVAPMLAR